MKLEGWRLPVAVGALIRVLTWAAGLWSEGWVQSDTKQYWDLASQGLAGYTVYSGKLFQWALMRPPGYPTLLAAMRLVSDSHAGVALLQVGFGVAAIRLTHALALRLGGASVASLAAWWLALSPIHVVESSVLLSEVPFSVLLLTGVLLVAPRIGGFRHPVDAHERHRSSRLGPFRGNGASCCWPLSRSAIS